MNARYQCPHCDGTLDHVVVVVIDTVPLPPMPRESDGRRRHAVDDARRAEVWATHLSGGVAAVMAQLGVSKSQAYRLVAQARPPVTADTQGVTAPGASGDDHVTPPL